MKVQAAPKEHFNWIKEKTHCTITEGFRGIEAIDSRGNIRGFVGFDCWTENAVQAHMAVETPIAWRALLGPAFYYPFVQARKNVLLGIIPAHNTSSLRMTKHLGFRLAHRIRDGWAMGDDLLLFEMRRDECRFLPKTLKEVA